MLSIKEELKLFKPKSINTYEIPMNDLNDILDGIQKKINNIDKASKKNSVSMEMINEEIREKNSEILELKNQLKDKLTEEEMFTEKILNILDHIDNVYVFAIKSNNNELANNINSVIKIIKDDLLQIEFEEIPTIGTIFNPQLHECVGTITDCKRKKYEIVDVIKKGYKFKQKIIRTAHVIAIK
ncbi:molecular chaperone GrpE [Clostridium novyi B str. ATCC 27606]|uniref:Molecular chaperone GrpE n=2 Tax=Clostridium TaxID=1485 RepID=A0AA40IU62_CLONO|nr:MULTISPECIES: nucleotide exchange factor GrpE [Clostridium]KEI13904.1 molecular chaperone GrpE [Clostridium novyi B str. NCTC 9691]KEI16106.1 molecular chaperone GrpE [Clostridium haemolyticum NCTC 9693]KEI16281.1 molecular chaperone GrpE [Clostridium novyi B str. ATCC 27606]KGN04471.1 molecular chaperone GrpE [Clostridium haemolyticum NCTC 8350]CAG7840487.1 Protein GrpE [Clostridium haemolyticum]